MPFDNPPQGLLSDLEILLNARSRIDNPNRWLKGDFRKDDRHCLVSALTMACRNPQFAQPSGTERRLILAMARQLPGGWGRLPRMICFKPMQRLIRFNDGPCTTHGDVMALFDRTIQHLATKAQATLAH
jgi:hypothetical protein